MIPSLCLSIGWSEPMADREELEKYLSVYTLDEILDYNNIDIIDVLLILENELDFELPYTKPL